MIRVVPILHVVAFAILVLAFGMLVPLATSLLYGDGAMQAFELAILATGAFGAVLWFSTRHGAHRELQTRDGFLLVSLIWSVLPGFAAIPFLAYLPALSVTDAYFEAVSGLTASGGTVLTGLDALPPSINVWRALLVWVGGLGVVVLAVAILPMLGVGGSQVFRAETPGPMKDTRLTPRITQTAKGLWLVYVGLTVACMLAYRAAGMDWLDAVVHAFTTTGLGGFSTHDASFAHWNSPLIEAIAIVFMVLSGINFGVHFLAIRRRSIAVYGRDPEVAIYLVVLLVSVVGIAAFLHANGVYDTFATALRHAAFNVVSVATTTGYANTDYALWPVFAPVWMLFLCCFATCSGSTGGGIKMIRARLMAAQALREMTRIVHPRAFVPVKLAGGLVENNIVFAVLAFMLVYGTVMITGTMLLALTGADIVTAFSAVVASLNNTGPGLGAVGPSTTFAGLTDFQTWVCTAAMLLGRLELFTLLVVFTPGFWRR
jgi:trk system potassium uptake protein TrkH